MSYILPFMVSKSYNISMFNHDLKLYRIAILLDNGETLLNDVIQKKDITKKLLEPNDIIPLSVKTWEKENDILYIPINSKKTNLDEFVLYDGQTELNGLVWRVFYYLADPLEKKSFLDSWNYPNKFEIYLTTALKVWNNINI